MATEPYAAYFAGWKDTKEFADDLTTAERLRAARFVDVETSLDPAPTVLAGADEFSEFLTTVNMHAHLARLPKGRLRRQFVDDLMEHAAVDEPPYSLDYCRLNITARPPNERLKPLQRAGAGNYKRWWLKGSIWQNFCLNDEGRSILGGLHYLSLGLFNRWS